VEATTATPASSAARLLHLGVLYSLAVAEPLLDVLGRNADFFTSRQSTGGDVVVFALIAALAPPLAAGLLVLAVARVSERAAAPLQLLLVGLLVALIAAQAVKHDADPPAAAAIAVAAAAGIAGAALYARVAALRSVLTWFSPLPLAVLALFVFHAPAHELIFSTNPAAADVPTASDTPVVMVVFDEFTGTSLLDAHNRIDPVLFPTFAGLVRGGGVYYRNYTAVTDETTRGLSALLTGNLWREHVLPIASAYPHNLFTLLGGSYRLVVGEETSELCPANLCREARGSAAARQRSLLSDAGLVYLHRVAPRGLERRLTPVNETLGPFGDAHTGAQTVLGELGGGARPARFEQWVAQIDGRPKTLYFKHVLLPHVPWQYLPDGRVYRQSADYVPALNSPESFGDPWLLIQAYQRHLLQAGFADRLLGRLVARLKQTGLYDRALIVVTADNGESFLHAGHDPHVADPETFTDIADTPLLVKLPGSRTGGYDDRHVRTVDILPTIADVLGVRLPWPVAGRSILHGSGPARVYVHREQLKKGPTYSISLAGYVRARAAALARKVALFGSDGGKPGIFGPGPDASLIGRPLAALPVAAAGALHGSFTPAVRDLLARVDLGSGFVPAELTGTVSGPGARRGLPVALALDGTVAAGGWTAAAAGSDQVYFTFMAPPAAFRSGSNRAEVLLVHGRRGALRLQRLARTG
jgi:hypothetical protein